MGYNGSNYCFCDSRNNLMFYNRIVMMTNYKITIAALCCLTIVECVALLKGINGVLLTLFVGAICALAGIAAPTPKFLQ